MRLNACSRRSAQQQVSTSDECDDAGRTALVIPLLPALQVEFSPGFGWRCRRHCRIKGSVDKFTRQYVKLALCSAMRLYYIQGVLCACKP